MTDDELYRDAIKKFEIIERMIDDEFSSRDETSLLVEAINKLYERIKELRNFSKF